MANKNVVIKGYIYAGYGEHSKEFMFTFLESNEDKISKAFTKAGYIPIAPYSIEIEMPENIDLHNGHLLSLQNKRKLILAHSQGELNEIDAKIQEFMAIENKSWYNTLNAG